MKQANPDDFSTLIRRARTEKGLTQVQLAKILDFSQPYLNLLENGKAVVKHQKKLIQIADALGIEFEKLKEAADKARIEGKLRSMDEDSEPTEGNRKELHFRSREFESKMRHSWESFLQLMANPSISAHEAAFLWSSFGQAMNNEAMISELSRSPSIFPEISKVIINILFSIQKIKSPSHDDVKRALDHFLPQMNLPSFQQRRLHNAILKSFSYTEAQESLFSK